MEQKPYRGALGTEHGSYLEGDRVEDGESDEEAVLRGVRKDECEGGRG